MNVVDLVVLGLLVVNVILGIVRGFALQAFRLGSVVLAVLLARVWAEPFGDFAKGFFDWPPFQLQALGWVVIGGGVYLVMLMIGHYAKNLIQRLRMGGADRALGALLGGLKGLLWATIGLYAITAVLLAGTWVLPASIKSELGTSQAFAVYSSSVKPWLDENMKATIDAIRREAGPADSPQPGAPAPK